MKSKILLPSFLVAMSSLPLYAFGQNAGSSTLSLDVTALDFKGSRSTGTMYMPDGIQLSEKKPTGITKEPTYASTPQYGVLHLGDGPHPDHIIAIDSPADGSDAKIYVDTKGDGDLVTGNSGKWDSKSVNDGITEYKGTYTLRVSYGNPHKESVTGSYALNFYWQPGRTSMFFYRASTRVGKISLGGQTYTVKLIENNNNGVYNTPFVLDKKPTKPVWIVLDGTMADMRGTFPVDGYNYQAMVSDDGSRLTLKPTSRVIAAPKASAPRDEALLAVGTMAPDFEVPAWGGGTVRLSSLRGKIVVLDFWATWCGPCKASLPHVQKVYDQVKDKNVAFVAMNVWDEKPAYDEWIPANKQYSLPFSFDPAGRGITSIATSQYRVSGIPTTYVIGTDGKIAASILGFNGLGDHRLEEALSKLNVPIEAPKSMPMMKLGGK